MLLPSCLTNIVVGAWTKEERSCCYWLCLRCLWLQGQWPSWCLLHWRYDQSLQPQPNPEDYCWSWRNHREGSEVLHKSRSLPTLQSNYWNNRNSAFIQIKLKLRPNFSLYQCDITKSDNIIRFLTALQIQYRYSSRNLAHGSWNFWYLIEVQTIHEKCVVFFSLTRS